MAIITSAGLTDLYNQRTFNKNGSTVTLKKISDTEWMLFGDLAEGDSEGFPPPIPPATIARDMVDLQDVYSDLVFRIPKSMFLGFAFQATQPNTLVNGDFVAPLVELRGDPTGNFSLNRVNPEFETDIAVFDLEWKGQTLGNITSVSNILVVNSTSQEEWFSDWLTEMPEYIELVFKKVYNSNGLTQFSTSGAYAVAIPTSAAIYYEVDEETLPSDMRFIDQLTPAPVSQIRYDLEKFNASAPNIPPSTAYSYVGYLKKISLGKEAKDITPSECLLGILTTPSSAMLVANGQIVEEQSFTLTNRIDGGGTSGRHEIVGTPNDQLENDLSLEMRWSDDFFARFGTGEFGNLPWVVEKVSMSNAALVVVTDFDSTLNGDVWDYSVDFYNTIERGPDPSLSVTHCLHYKEN